MVRGRLNAAWLYATVAGLEKESQPSRGPGVIPKGVCVVKVAPAEHLSGSGMPDTARHLPACGNGHLGKLMGPSANNIHDGKLYCKRDNGNGALTIVELGSVRFVAGKTGEVNLTATDVGLGQVTNTADRD